MRMLRATLVAVLGALVAAPVAALPANAVDDVTAPRVTGIAVLTPVVSAGDAVVLRLTATDDLSGVASLAAQLSGSGPTTINLLSPDSTAAFLAPSGLVSGVVPIGAMGGPLSLVSVVVGDNAGNSTTYTPTTTTSMPPGPTNTLDLSTASVTVTQPLGQDVTAPRVTSLRMLSSVDRRPGEFATFSFTTSDDRSPVTQLRIDFCDELDAMALGVRGGGRLSSGRLSVWFPTDLSPLSTWHVCGVSVTDSAGNGRRYSNYSYIQIGLYPGAPRPDPLVQQDVRPDSVVTTSLSSTMVPVGTAISVRGTVTYAGVLVPCPVVAVYAERAGVRTLVGITRGTSAGTYAKRVVPVGTTVYRTYFLGSDRGGAQSARGLGPGAKVWTGTRQSLAVPTISVYVRAGSTGVLPVTLLPRRAALVVLQRWTGRVWARVVTLRTRSTGVAAYRVPRPASATAYRWTTAYDGVGLPAVSRIVTVRRA
ncbi:MAG TPA: hypothetical protein VFL59_06820 [Candidatus Nanopelagicales bacterium]|nr:hypothetical protein [Candidatus Nanopelagicales bacterium]